MTQRTIRNLITRREVVLLPPNASVRDASQLMAQQHVGAILVMVDDQLEGIFSERDALKRVLAEGRDPDATQLSEVMTKDVVTLGPDAWALDALRLMRDIGFRHLPVVEQDLVIGVISLRDFVGAELQQVGVD